VTIRPSNGRSYDDTLPTARTTLHTKYVRVLVFCNSCRHQADADLQAIVDAGRGDVSLTKLRFRCSRCGTDRTDFVVTSRDVVRPWPDTPYRRNRTATKLSRILRSVLRTIFRWHC
jgi:hypothetical protein